MHPRSEFILGGQRSGKSRCGEQRAADWLAQPGHRAVLLATALGGDDEMRARIRRHQADRAERVPAMALDEVPRDLAGALRRHSAPDCLVLVDCLTLWLTQWLMPLEGAPVEGARWLAVLADLEAALQAAAGPVVLVSNEIGLGLSPMSREARHYVDELGRLHQQVAARCPRVTLMVAGLEMAVKPW
jgi:adenosylcobinamide kinase/adenosylcobinamide-phosphate guanylyltransferase